MFMLAASPRTWRGSRVGTVGEIPYTTRFALTGTGQSSVHPVGGTATDVSNVIRPRLTG